MADFALTSPKEPTFYFIGVTTGQSSSRQIFPLWMEALGRSDVCLQGIDLPIHADPSKYRTVVGHIKHEPLALGALVTTHKIDLLTATHDLFDELGPFATITNEVSSIAKDGDHLVGRATDPLAGGLSLDALLGRDYFAQSGGQVLLLGAGGSAVALSLHLLRKLNAGDRPQHITVVNRSAGRLDRLAQMVEEFDSDIQFDYIQNDRAQYNDDLMARLPSGSVVINATGMGKDTPGSPLTDAAEFPVNGVAWELNYRGKLDFLQQARRQRTTRYLTIADGWTYFVHGWSQVISHVLHVKIDPPLFTRLSEIAVAGR